VPGSVDVTVAVGVQTSPITPDDQYTFQGDLFAYVTNRALATAIILERLFD